MLLLFWFFFVLFLFDLIGRLLGLFGLPCIPREGFIFRTCLG
jgi:hypothetical protein